jgi:hypothetical protein
VETEQFIADQRTAIEAAFQKLSLISETDAAHKRGNAWSKKEIIGHLIDSAANNHQRFVRAQFTTELIGTGYEQDDWVKAQHYQAADWQNLLHLWRSYNLHLLHVISCIPGEQLHLPRRQHNVHLIGFRPHGEGEPATLDFLVRDYYAHLYHHLEAALRAG